MVKVIVDKLHKKCVCLECGSILEYEPMDVHVEQVQMNEYKKTIVCPVCCKSTEIFKSPQLNGNVAQKY